MMISLSEIIIISLSTFAVHLFTREGMIFGFVERFWGDKTGWKESISKPISECPTCMGFWWGMLGYFLICPDLSLLGLTIATFAVVTLNTIISTFYYSNN